MAERFIRKRVRRFGPLAVSPLFVLVALFFGFSFVFGSVSEVPLLVVFLCVAIYSLAITRGLSVEKRILKFSEGAGNPSLILMVWIFILAGAFASSAKDMGAVDACVNATINLVPSNWILAGIFIASCFISLSIGTSVGTIVAIVPVAAGLSVQSGIPLPLLVAVVVGGAFFGDNLSFISDTTIVATQTQGCDLKDKFKVNVLIVLPAAFLVLLIYLYMGYNQSIDLMDNLEVRYVLIIPYIAVLLLALSGVNVMLVLLIGCVMTGVTGGIAGTLDFMSWLRSMVCGVLGMGELIVVTMLAGGILELIKYNGGIAYLIKILTRNVHGKKGAELCIASLVSLTNLCTANNTIAILSVGKIANTIAEKYGVDKRKSASLLDTFSCCMQGLMPYGAQVLIASSLALVSPMEILPYLYYPFLIGVSATLAIIFRFPKCYSR